MIFRRHPKRWKCAVCRCRNVRWRRTCYRCGEPHG